MKHPQPYTRASCNRTSLSYNLTYRTILGTLGAAFSRSAQGHRMHPDAIRVVSQAPSPCSIQQPATITCAVVSLITLKLLIDDAVKLSCHLPILVLPSPRSPPEPPPPPTLTSPAHLTRIRLRLSFVLTPPHSDVTFRIPRACTAAAGYQLRLEEGTATQSRCIAPSTTTSLHGEGWRLQMSSPDAKLTAPS